MLCRKGLACSFGANGLVLARMIAELETAGAKIGICLQRSGPTVEARDWDPPSPLWRFAVLAARRSGHVARRGRATRHWRDGRRHLGPALRPTCDRGARRRQWAGG